MNKRNCAICRQPIAGIAVDLRQLFPDKRGYRNFVHPDRHCPPTNSNRFANGCDHTTLEPTGTGTLLDAYKAAINQEEPKSEVKPTLFTARPSSTFKLDKHARGFLITSAINNTYADPQALAVMRRYADHLGYQLIVGCERYQNPSSPEQSTKLEASYWWDPVLSPYLVDSRLDLFGDGLVIVSAEVRQRATTRHPLSLFDVTQDGALQILPFGKLHLVPCVRHVSEPNPTFLATTGSVTPYDYSATAVGFRAGQEHTLGVTLVERREDGFFNFRQLEIDAEYAIHDLNTKITPTTVETGNFTRLIYGYDLHANSAYGPALEALSRLITDLSCPELVFGDLINWEHSHHKNSLQSYGLEPPTQELFELKRIIQSLPEPLKITVPHSNHHDHIELWLDRCLTHGTKNPIHWPAICELGTLKLADPKKPAIQAWWEVHGDREINWLSVSDSYKVDGVENGQHGHIGVCGSRGSLQQFAKIRERINIGHIHYASRLNAAMSAGVSGPPDSHDYANKGFTNWSISVIVQYQNGSRSHLHFFNGSFV